jgi:hypothetical protein
MQKNQLIVITAVIFIAALSRLFPHPPNVAPIAAIALFGGAQLADRRLAFLIPLAAMLVSDIMIGFHPGMFVVYLGMICVTAIGFLLRKNRTVLKVAAATLASSLVFFAVTNFVLLHNAHQLYPYTVDGMITSYVAALPFLRNTLLGDLFFAGLLFGGYALLQKRIPSLRTA